MEKARVLEQLIKEQGMNPRSFSEKCGLPYSTVYTILKKGAGKANVNNVIIMCKVLGITVEELDEMSKGVKVEPNYRDVISVYTRSRKNLSQEEKMRLARIILSDDEDDDEG